MKQVLLFDTAIATTNIGDEIIFDSVKEGLSRILDESLVFRLGTHIENYNAFQMYHNLKYKLLCQNADYKFICGTNLLAETVKGRFSQWQINPFNFSLYEGSVLVGVGRRIDYTFVDNYTARLYKKILSKKYVHSVRDDETKRVVEALGLTAINTGCPTLWKLTPEFCEGIPQTKAKNAVLSVSGYEGQSNPDADVKLIDIVKSNYQDVYVWIQTAVDEKYFDSLPNSDGVTHIYSLNKFSDVLMNRNVDYIGTRLHGGIFALQHQVRTIVVSIDERAEGFHQTNNLPIVRRDEIELILEKTIHSAWKTKIVPREKEIKEFLNQFI